MIEGESGLLGVFPPEQRPTYEPSKRRVTFHNGATATAFSADEPDRLRGPNHDLAWCDELAAWRYPEAWDMLTFGLRIGDHPRVVVTTTPKPTLLIKNLMTREDTHVTRGSTFDNSANLAPAFLDEVTARYEGTRLGRQELHAEILDDVDGALWSRDMLDDHRVTETPALTRLVIAVDPAISSTAESAETGIIAVGVDDRQHGYVLHDRTTRGTPHEWAQQAVALYHTLKADRIIAESNQGGDMVKHTLATVDPNAPVRLVHASRGKRTRAEPVAALYEQGRIHHVGAFNDLEDQLCSWVPGEGASPDRLDALVWGFTELLVGHQAPPAVIPSGLAQSNPWSIS
jgi:phage terminase large subunit-like protein